MPQKKYYHKLKTQMSLFKEKHPETLTSMNEIGVVLSNQGKYEAAEKMHRETLQLSEKVLGKEHPETLTSMNNLALVLSNQGKYEATEKMHRETLQLKEKVLGKEHPSALTSMNNLAFTLRKLGRQAEAKQIDDQIQTMNGEELSYQLQETIAAPDSLQDIAVNQLTSTASSESLSASSHQDPPSQAGKSKVHTDIIPSKRKLRSTTKNTLSTGNPKVPGLRRSKRMK